MENTLENKAKFFAQYWGQRILNPYSLLTYTNTGVMKLIDHIQLSGLRENDRIELKPLSSISDEDAKTLNRTSWGTKYKSSEEFLTEFNVVGFLTSDEADALRRMGYAVLYNNTTVEKQIEYGWIKLNNPQ